MDVDASTRSSTSASSSATTVPTAGVLCIAIGVYVTLVLIGLAVRKYIKTKEVCGCVKNFPCSMASCSGTDTCSRLDEQLRAVGQFSQNCSCGWSKKCCDCQLSKYPDLLWHGCQSWTSRCLDRPIFNCGLCDCTCSCRLPECQSINCCCFEIHIKK